jgi:hypothetical protein
MVVLLLTVVVFPLAFAVSIAAMLYWIYPAPLLLGFQRYDKLARGYTNSTLI